MIVERVLTLATVLTYIQDMNTTTSPETYTDRETLWQALLLFKLFQYMAGHIGGAFGGR